MSSETVLRILALRQYLNENQLDAFILPTADAHLSEYQTLQDQRVTWLTGFHGENCVTVITRDKAAIFVDGRFTVQIRQQVPADIFEYLHVVNDCHLAWTNTRLSGSARIGIDASLFDIDWFRKAKRAFEEHGHRLISVPENPVDTLWRDRPAPPSAEITLFRGAGCSSVEKRERLARKLCSESVNAMLLTQPEDINWLTNIRGGDIPNVLATQGFAMQHDDSSLDLFIEAARLPEGFVEWVGDSVRIHAPGDLACVLTRCASQTVNSNPARILVTPGQTNAWLYNLLQDAGAVLVEGENSCARMRAIKNDVELNGMKAAHHQDAIAMCRFLAWLDGEVAAGRPHNEASLADQLEQFRIGVEGYLSPSFDTISALGPNAAMCHYHHDPVNSRELGQDAIYLVDSGGHYNDGGEICGTTDITRTIAVGKVSAEQRRLFTLVLKGHINLDRARFLPGTSGQQLDILARQPLWREGFNYDHGTGHGVGHLLSVHEFPPGIRPNRDARPLEPGMCISNEPGYYRYDHGREGSFGIRLENIISVYQPEQTGDLLMYGLQTMTWVPFDLRLVDVTILDESERVWLNSYHAKVYQRVAESLDEADRLWLEQATRAI